MGVSTSVSGVGHIACGQAVPLVFSGQDTCPVFEGWPWWGFMGPGCPSWGQPPAAI